jgi:hypothetical protein
LSDQCWVDLVDSFGNCCIYREEVTISYVENLLAGKKLVSCLRPTDKPFALALRRVYDIIIPIDGYPRRINIGFGDAMIVADVHGWKTLVSQTDEQIERLVRDALHLEQWRFKFK